MKPKFIALSVFLCAALLLSGCGGGGDTKDQPANSSVSNTASSSEKSSSGFTKISDIADAWNKLYTGNETEINAYEGMPILELVTPATAFITGVQYDVLNVENKEGRFEGELMLAGYPAFIEKDGKKLTFGYDYVRDKAGIGPSMKAGDRIAENGSFLMDKEYYTTETFTERDGQKIERRYVEFKRLKDKSMICLDISGSTLNAKGEAKIVNNIIFIKAGLECYDFVIGSAGTGPDFTKLSLADKSDLTKEQAKKLFTDAGYKIEKTGSIKASKLVVD